MDFREFSKQYNDWLMHAGMSNHGEKKMYKEANFLKNYIVNNNVPGGLADYNEFYEKCSLADWRKAIQYAQQGDKTGVQSMLLKYTLGKPVNVTGTSLTSKRR